MPITLKVEAQADNRSFKQAADQAVKVFDAAGREASGSFSKQFGEGAKDIDKALSKARDAYDAVADATGKATTAEKQRQQYLKKSEDLTKAAEAAEKKLGAARDSGDTKAAASAEKELQRVRDQLVRTDTQIVRSAEAVSSSRRKEARELREAVASYRELESAQRRAASPGFGRSFDSYGRSQGVMSGALSQSSGMVGQFNSLGGSSGKAFVGGAVAAILAGGLVAAGAKAAGMVADGFKSVMETGIDFSRTINEFTGVTGASASQTEKMAAAARALGSDTTLAGVSASDAALAMTELAKAGFTVDEAIESARGTMQLATAAGIDAAAAAEIQANAINAYGLSVDDAANVADVLANAEVGSSAGITDIAQALQQVSGISRGFGEDIHGTTAALMMLADAGIKGSDAGTLLKSTLQSITDKSNPAQDAIDALGLSLYDFGTGQFVGFRELFRQLDEAKARMSPEQFQAETNVLFGSDAMRAPMLGSLETYDKALAKTYELGTAADMSKAKMQGWPGVVEGIDNSLGELKLSLFDIFDTPTGRDFGKGIVDSLDGLVDWVNTHKPEIIGFVSSFVSAWATGTDSFLTYVARITDAGSIMQEVLSHTVGSVLEGVAKMASGVGAVLKHIPGMGEIGSNLEGAGTAVDNIMDKWQNLGSVMRSGSDSIDQLREGIRGMRDGITGSLGEIALAESRNRVYAQSFKDIQAAVELVPETKQIVVTDNSPEIRQKLTELGFAVQELPNGQLVINVEYRDPAGRLVDPAQLGVSQRQLDDRTSRQHDWGINDTPPVAPGGPAGPWAPSSARGGAGGSSLPDAPVLPIAYTDTTGMSPEMANAQNRLDETKHDLEEKQARLNQLLAANIKDENEIQKARNDVAKAQQDADIAQRRMQESQLAAYGKSAKQMNGMTSELGQIGAALDSDFGISKGLAGIAENITKFIANLAAAPLLGMLSAVDKANPNEGSGMVGMLAANGTFGSQYTPGAIGASQMGPAMLQPGTSGVYGNPVGIDAALLSRVPAGRYTQEERGDLTQGLADCSSAVEDLVNLLDGRPTGGASMSTGNAAQWLTERGFLPGTGGIGDMRVAFNPNHMQATLPGGTPFNWGSDAAAAVGGRTSRGADDPSLTQQYYRPVGVTAPATAPVAAPALTIPQSPVYNTSPGLTPALTGVPSLPGGPLGTGMPTAAPFTGATPAVGAGTSYPSQGGNSGNILGGMALDGIMAATSGLDMMMPGAGAAAKIGVQLANRTIGYGAQNVGIGVSGILETLSLGDNPMGSLGAGWFGKLAGGIAGAAPALPNMAGASAPGHPAGGNGQGDTTANTTNNNLTVNNTGATENQNGKTLTEHLVAMREQPGRQ